MQASNKIQCRICGGEFHMISPTHLKKHDMTNEQYHQQFPDAPMASPKQKASLLKGLTSDQRKKRRSTLIELDCKFCGKPFKTKVNLDTMVPNRIHCNRTCSNKSRQGEKLSVRAKKKAKEKIEERTQKTKHPWENVVIREDHPLKYLQDIRELYLKFDPNANIEICYKLENGCVIDFAFINEKIGVSFLPGWTPVEKIPNHLLEGSEWKVCEVFSIEPSKAFSILRENIGKVHSISYKDAYFRYVSDFYQAYKNSIVF